MVERLPTFADDGRQETVQPEDYNAIVDLLHTPPDVLAVMADVDGEESSIPTLPMPGSSPLIVQVTDADGTNYVQLPAPAVGATVVFLPEAEGNGFNLISSDPENIGINGGAEEDAESAVGDGVVVTCICATETNWVCTTIDDDGTAGALSPAADPGD